MPITERHKPYVPTTVVALKAKNLKTTATAKILQEYGAHRIYIREPDWSKEQFAQLSR